MSNQSVSAGQNRLRTEDRLAAKRPENKVNFMTIARGYSGLVLFGFLGRQDHGAPGTFQLVQVAYGNDAALGVLR